MEVLSAQGQIQSVEFPLENNSSTRYLSAPTSPNRNSCISPYYYSVPSSPTRGLTILPYDLELEPIGPKGSMGTITNTDDFEFETSSRYEISRERQHQQQQQHQQKHQLHVEDPPRMSFADELFCNGRVLPLKLPPRLQFPSEGRASNRSSSASSPRSPISVLKSPFSSVNFKCKDFDPFMTALENVSKEERGRDQVGPNRRTTQSKSPTRASHWVDESTRKDEHQVKAVGHMTPAWDSIEEMRLASMGHAGPKRSGPTSPDGTNSPVLVPTTGTTGPPNKISKTRGSSSKGSKRWKISGFLFRSASEGRTDPKDKLRVHTAALTRPGDGRASRIRDVHGMHHTANTTGFDQLTKRTYLPYKPGLLGCLGFSSKVAKNMKSKDLD